MQGSLFDLPNAPPAVAAAKTTTARRVAVTECTTMTMLDVARAGDDVRPDDQEGTWTGTELSLREHLAVLDAAHANLDTADLRVRPYFALGIAARRAALARMLERDPDVERVSRVWGAHEKLSLAAGHVLTALCEPGVVPGAEARCRASRNHREAVLFVAGLGTLELGSWVHEDGGGGSVREPTDSPFVLVYEPTRTSAVEASYRDARRTVEAPIGVWGQVAAAQLSSSAERPSVPAYVHAGRRYVTTGAFYCGSYAEGYAWALEARDDWSGPVYTRAELLSLWDRGIRERGDDRGLMVSVRGSTFVLGSPVLFLDRAAPVPRSGNGLAPADADLAPGCDEDDEAADEDGENAEAA
jgi:hypothetical protein